MPSTLDAKRTTLELLHMKTSIEPCHRLCEAKCATQDNQCIQITRPIPCLELWTTKCALVCSWWNVITKPQRWLWLLEALACHDASMHAYIHKSATINSTTSWSFALLTSLDGDLKQSEVHRLHYTVLTTDKPRVSSTRLM